MEGHGVTKLEEHGESREHGEHGKYGKHPPYASKHSLWKPADLKHFILRLLCQRSTKS